MPFRLTEDAFIALVKRLASGAGVRPVAGIGDDTAILSLPRSAEILLTTDFLTDGVHFLADRTPGALVGRKAMAVNVSDIAAMGGVAHSAVLSVGFPRDIPPAWARDLARGLASAARRHGVAIVGGDTCAARGVFVNVAVLGLVERGRAVRRSGARSGDGLYVTGRLGASAAGLSVLLGRGSGAGRSRAAGRRAAYAAAVPTWRDPARRAAVRAHLDPSPRTTFGRALGRTGVATAMIDLSDGLSRDLPRLAAASGVGAIVAAGAVPVHPAAIRVLGPADALAAALGGGEDYELLFAARPQHEGLLAALARRLRIPVTRIGTVRPRREGIRLLTRDGRYVPLPAASFEHFPPPRRAARRH